MTSKPDSGAPGRLPPWLRVVVTWAMAVGGQAVIEGVMMRSPRSFTVVCRRPDGSLVIREAPWVSVWERLRFLRWPFLRGAVVFWESLYNGMSALSFSAKQQLDEGEQGAGDKADAALTGTLVLSLALGFLLFAALPHMLTWVLGNLLGIDLGEGRSLAFQLVDGAFKLALFLGYLWGISRMEDIRRVFMYHGAEHKGIFTYEAGEDLTVDNARPHTTRHPRCGTSFLILVLMVSILVFTVAFGGPWMPVFSEHRILNQLAYIGIKLPLMFPIAGISYEVLRLSGKHPDSPLLRPLVAPGLWLQGITTREPTDDMLEVSLLSLRKVLWREAEIRRTGEIPRQEPEVEVYESADLVDLPVRFDL